MHNKIIIGISGTSGVILGIKLIEFLKNKNWETHLIITKTAKEIIKHETSDKLKEIEEMAFKVHKNDDFFSEIASGSFKTDGMIIIPCSMKTLSGIANGYSDNLMIRCADVILKEKRKLILVVRETPLNSIHIENMQKVTNAGGVILPAVITLYSKPKGIEDMINHLIGKVLDVFGIENEIFTRWNGKI